MKYISGPIRALVAAGIFCLSADGCVQKMGSEGHLRPMEGAAVFNQLTRQAPEGTLPQASSKITQSSVRPRVTRAFLERGREQYQVFCLPCHGVSGHGDGMIVQRGFLAPPSYHTPQLRQADDVHFFDVITKGYGAMFSYADRVSIDDRWAITAYIRALQFSQNAPWSKLTREDQEKLR